MIIPWGQWSVTEPPSSTSICPILNGLGDCDLDWVKDDDEDIESSGSSGSDVTSNVSSKTRNLLFFYCFIKVQKYVNIYI